MPRPAAPDHGLLPMLDVDGVYNFRDVGGVSTSDDRLVLPGRIYRSASLDSITSRGLETLAGLGVRTVIDIRSQAEVDRHGRFPHEGTGIEWFHMVSSVGPPSGQDRVGRLLMNSPDPMLAIFPLLVTRAAPMFAGALRLVAEAGRQPVVFHCTSGKDRTGLLALLIHLVVGVELETGLLDFERSTEVVAEVRAQMAARYTDMATMPPEVLDRMAGAERSWVAAALDAIGGVDNLEPWLDSIGVDASVRRSLRSILISS